MALIVTTDGSGCETKGEYECHRGLKGVRKSRLENMGREGACVLYVLYVLRVCMCLCARFRR